MVRLTLFLMVTISIAGHTCASDAPRVVIAVDDASQASPLIASAIPDQLLPGLAPSPLAPPPGTLGRTYQLPSRPVPLDEHPRTGMLVVRTRSPLIHLHVDRMGGFRRSDGSWQFKSDRPLIPGVPSIVAVEARDFTEDADPLGVRFVRLIPGRVVYLDF